MAGNAIVLKPGEALMVVAASSAYPDNTLPVPMPPVDPGYSPPWAQVGGPRPSHPIYYPPGSLPHPDQGLPGYQPYPDQGLPGSQPHPSHPIVIPPTTPPPVTPPTDEGGNWVWAWSPQMGRWVWVKVPGEGEAGPKT